METFMGCMKKSSIILLVLTACSNGPLRNDFEELPSDHQKDAYIRYYPVLDKDQRRALIHNSWEKVPKETEAIPIPPNVDIDKHKIKTLEIKTTPDKVITEGDTVEFTGTLEYTSGLKTEATDDITWSAAPESVKVKKNKLTFQCLSSDIHLTGDFLGYKKTTLPIKVRKPIDSLQMNLGDQAMSVEDDVHIKMNLVAKCKDGTSTDVSCLADWKPLDRFGTMKGCGMFHVNAKRVPAGQKITFRAEYGGRFIEKLVQLPERR
jgi:hypothetical protein